MVLPSRTDRTVLPAALVAVLAALALFQLVAKDDILPPEGVGRVVVPSVRDYPLARVRPDPAILSRAMFAPVARPGDAAAPVVTGPLGDAAPVGVTCGRGFARVIIQRTNGSIVSVPVGGRYGVWRVVAIGRDAAVFSSESGTVRIPLADRAVSTGSSGQPSVAEEK